MSEHPFLDATLAEQLLEKAIAERGEDHTAECVYVNEDAPELQPMCIVGVGLYALGWSIEELLDFGCDGTDALFLKGILKGSPEARAMLTAAQEEQDNGGDWGYALQCARELKPSC